MFKTILAAVDGSDHAMKALDTAAEMAVMQKARLLILSVYSHFSPMENTHSLVRARQELAPPDDALREFASDVVKVAAERARASGAREMDTFIAEGHPARTIVEFARDKKVDLIVMGNRGWGDVGSFLLGSVSHKVNSLAECTCITVK